MIFNLQDDTDIQQAKERFNSFLNRGKTIDLIEKKNTRTTRQNKALHLLFTIVSEQLNELGIEFQYFGLKGKVLSVMHTPNLVKEHVWKPIQRTLFDIESTTKINTEQINTIVDVLAKYFAEKGIEIEFPSKEALEKLIN